MPLKKIGTVRNKEKMKLKGKPRWEASKTIIWGLVFTTAMGALWYSLAGNPFTNYEIMMRGVHIVGTVHDCNQEYAERDSGQGGPFQRCGYTFEVRGVTFGGIDDFANETNDGDNVPILYLPESPNIHVRELGAATGFLDWLFRKVILSLILLAIFVGAGIPMIWGGIKSFYFNEIEMVKD